MTSSPPVRWALIVLSWNGRDDTLTCLRSIARIGREDTAVIVVDNGSTDGTVQAVRERFPDVEVVETGANLGFAGGNNAGIRRAVQRGAEWVVLVNNDAELAPDAIDALDRAAARHPRAGVLAGKVYFADPPDLIWFAGQSFHAWLGYSGRARGYRQRDAGRYRRPRPTGRASGAFMAVSRAAIDAVGMLDDDLFLYVEDVDWSLRVAGAGFAVRFVPDARAWHRVSASTGGELTSTANVYYGVRNMVVVCERSRPLPAPLRTVRRAVIRATWTLHARRRPDRAAALAAVRAGYADAVAGRLGPRWEVTA